MQLDRYLLDHMTSMATLQETEAITVQEKVEAAIVQMETAALDCYDNISALSLFWESDETGGSKDSALFIRTISQLEKVEGRSRPLGDDEKVAAVNWEIISQADSIQGKRKLFILHYAGHAIASAPSNILIITSRISKGEFLGPQMSMTYIRDGLKLLAGDTEGLDVLVVLDCCCAAIAGRGKLIGGKRMELMAATSPAGLSNSREDYPGLTFTQHWCAAFEHYLKLERPFNCEDIRNFINALHDLEQFPATYVLREGWGAPITFRAPPAATTTMGPVVNTIITAIHVKEDHNSSSLAALIAYLEKAPMKITVVAALPVASTLLLLRVPQILQELLELPQVALIVLPTNV